MRTGDKIGTSEIQNSRFSQEAKTRSRRSSEAFTLLENILFGLKKTLKKFYENEKV
jgi:hypothetical protein